MVDTLDCTVSTVIVSSAVPLGMSSPAENFAYPPSGSVSWPPAVTRATGALAAKAGRWKQQA